MKKRTIGIILCLFLIVIGIIVNALYISPSKIAVRFETLESTEIPSSLDGVSIVFFSDLHFNGFVDQQRAQIIFDIINELNADVVLFGGDLLDHPATTALSEENQSYLIEALASINAPLGKFAVYGNHDLE